MQDIIAEYMKKGGHTCFTADDGIDALMILKSSPMDLMILDIMIPHIDGFTVCKMAREMSNMSIITATNEFGIIAQFGGISTYFKPGEGMAYWLEQIEKYVPK